MVRIGALSLSMGKYPFEEVLQYAKETGFDGIEVSTSPGVHKGTLDLSEGNLPKVKELIEKYGLSAFAVAGYNDFVQKDDNEMLRQVDKLEGACKIAKALGAPVVRAFGGEEKPGISRDDAVRLMIEGFGEATKRAEKLGIVLGLENHGTLTNDGRIQMKIVESVGSRWLGITVDTSNYRWFGNDLETIEEYFKMVAPYVVHTHLKDGSARKGFRNDYTALALGEGEINLPLILGELKKAGYSNPICIEFEGAEDPKVGLAKGIKYLKSALKELGWE